MRKFSDKEIIEGIFLHHSYILEYVYKKNYPVIRRLIRRNSGNDEDAKDVLQDAIIVIYRKIKKNDLNLNCSLGTYIYAVCRNIWLKKLRSDVLKSNWVMIDNEENFDLPDEVNDNYEEYEKYKIYQENFRRLNNNCKRILSLYLAKTPVKKISEITGYTEKYVRNMKLNCKKKLIENIKNNLNN